MKKLAVVVMMIAIATFMAAAMASADDRAGKKAIEGEYAFTGPGNCLVSTTGFDSNYAPNPGGQVFAVTQIWEGVYTFKRDGSGTITASHRSLDLPAGPIELANISWDFSYTMTDNERFTSNATSLDKVEWTAGPQAKTISYFEIDGP